MCSLNFCLQQKKLKNSAKSNKSYSKNIVKMIEDLDDSNVESRASEAANLSTSKKLSAVKILEDLGKKLHK